MKLFTVTMFMLLSIVSCSNDKGPYTPPEPIILRNLTEAECSNLIDTARFQERLSELSQQVSDGSLSAVQIGDEVVVIGAECAARISQEANP